MKNRIGLIIVVSLFSFGCGQNSEKEKDLEMKEKELELKEKELEIRNKELNNSNENGSDEDNSSSSQSLSSSSENEITVEKDEQALKNELWAQESVEPTKYLKANYTYRVNLVGNTIIEGSIANYATIAGFKNIKIIVYFYSKTDVLLGKESFTIMEFFPPKKSVTFRHKITGWWQNVAKSKYEVLSAEAY